jgi:hypothetical protein
MKKNRLREVKPSHSWWVIRLKSEPRFVQGLLWFRPVLEWAWSKAQGHGEPLIL